MRPFAVRLVTVATLVCAITVRAIAAPETTPPAPHGSLVVVIREGRTKWPVPLVTVVDTRSQTGAISSPAGVAELKALTPGRVKLRFYHERFLSRTATATVHAGRSDTLRIALTRDPHPRKDKTIMVDIKRPAWVW
jgi:hypothetical protein